MQKTKPYRNLLLNSKKFLHYKSRKIVASLFIISLTSLSIQNAALALTEAIKKAEQEWQVFRDTYPFHQQIVGLTSPLKDRSRILIVSEPPPHIKTEYFEALANQTKGKLFIKKNTIGYDGWTKDIVIAFPSLNEEKAFQLLAKLHQDIYGTTYKMQTLQLPISSSQKLKGSLNLSISAAELNSWFENKNLKFRSILGQTPKSLSNILSESKSGVFFSTKPGLVIWSISKNKDLAEYRSQARQFFLDSDLIIGAVGNKKQLIIVGRERIEPVMSLPPLRFETALKLADNSSVELAQSYERKNLFAGRLSTGQDWAPIYLSKNLVNTEFGSLLNITDQLLKSWSLNGNIEYINFNYPKPSNWPAFPSPLYERKSVLFNWNTSGASYKTSIKSQEFFALNKTGSLPITYGFDKKRDSNLVKNYEKIAYDYFSNLKNADLARAVQYTALFQIFRQFEIKTEQIPKEHNSSKKINILNKETFNLLEKIESLSLEKIEFLSQELESLIKDPQENNSKLQENAQVLIEDLKDITEFINLLKRGKLLFKEEGFLYFSKVIANPYENLPRNDELDSLNLKELWGLRIYLEINKPIIRLLLSGLFDINQVKNLYVQEFNKEENSWIKTPSIVLSKNIVNAELVGGHNLSSQIGRLQSNSEIPKGKINIIKNDSESIIEYNPEDVDKIHSLNRILTTEANNPNLINILENELKSSRKKKRKIERALYISSARKERGLNKSLEPARATKPLGWHLLDSPLSSQEKRKIKQAEELNSNSIFIEKSLNGYTIFNSNSDQLIEAHTLPSFIEAFNRTTSEISSDENFVQIYLDNFTPQEAHALIETAELRQIVLTRNPSFDQSIALLKRKYNWNEAKITDIKTERIKNSQYNYKQTIELEVKSTIPKVKPKRIRIIIFLKNLSEELTNKIKDIVNMVLSRSSSQRYLNNPTQRNLNKLISDISKEIKKEISDSTIEVYYDSEAGDIIITKSIN